MVAQLRVLASIAEARVMIRKGEMKAIPQATTIAPDDRGAAQA
jgi:hypothetical protein